MKNSIIPILLFLSCAIPVYSAKMDDANNGSKKSDLTILHNEKNHTRPNAPERNGIACFYGEWFIQIEMPADASIMTISIEQNGSVEWSGVITREETCVQLPVLNGTYIVRCETDTRQFFSGSISF